MIKIENKLALTGLLLIAVITACVQLPVEENPLPQQDESAGADVITPPAAPQTAEPTAVDAEPPQTAGQVPEGGEQLVAAGPPESSDADLQHPERSEAEPPLVESSPVVRTAYLDQVQGLCEQVGNKLGSVSVEDCKRQDFHFGGGFSINQRPLVIKEVTPEVHDDNSFRVFLMGGIHGDEYSSISIIFKWLELFSKNDIEGRFYWRFAPLVNPDGLLDGQARRQNANGVDLNRNFPSMDWNDFAAEYWHNKTGKNPRRYPGDSAASEPEVKWIIGQIEEFQPDVIVSVHAPYHLLDFDGPSEAPEKIGELYLHQLGVYPGSLGNYAGIDRQIPVVTLELPSAGILPSREQIRLMWLDLVAWLESADHQYLAN